MDPDEDSENFQATTAVAKQPTGTFHFLLLPHEIQSRIFAYAFEEGSNWPNLLCVCRRFFELGVPHRYRQASWGEYSPDRKLEFWQAHPEYAQHVRDLYLLGTHGQTVKDGIRLAKVIFDAIQAPSFPSRRLDCLSLQFGPQCMSDGSRAITWLQPSHLDWQSCWYEEYGVNPIAFAHSTTWEALQCGGFSRLVTLDLIEFYPDEATARLIAQMPNLEALTLMGRFVNKLTANSVITLLGTGHTRSNLKWFEPWCDEPTRRSIQQGIGMCIPARVTFDMYEDNVGVSIRGPEKENFHGCQTFTYIRREDDSGFMTAKTGCITCPRCCAIGGQKKIFIPEDQLGAHERLDEPRQDLEGGSSLPYGLCDQHHKEIFDATPNMDPVQREENFIRRRALECMRWKPNQG